MSKLAAFLRRDILWATATPFTLIMPFISIAIAVACFAYMSRLIDPKASFHDGLRVPYLTYVVVNMAFMLLLTTALHAASEGLRREQLIGTFEQIVASGTSNGAIALGSALWTLLFGAIQACFYFVAAFAFGVRFQNVDFPSLCLFAVLGVGCMSAFGILSAAMVVSFRQAPPSSVLVGGGASLLAGVLFPISLLPHWLQIVSWLLPMTHALNGFRGALFGESLASLAPDALWLLAASALLLPVSFVVFRRAVAQARFNGSFGNY